MVTLIASQLQDRLQDGSCLLTSGSQSTAALTAGTKSTTAALTTTAGTTTLKTGAGAVAAHGAGTTIAGAILGILVIGLVAYGVNKAVRAYIK